MVRHLTEGAEGVVAAGAYAHGAARLLHDGRLAAGARAVHHVRHQVQAGLQEQAVITRKELLPDQLFNLSRGKRKVARVCNSYCSAKNRESMKKYPQLG